MAEPDVVAWLLEGDPAVRWQVQRDLLAASPTEVAAERAAVATSGWGRRLLDEQDADGRWAGDLYSPKWTSTTYTLLLLAQLGLPGGHPAAQRGVELLLDGATYDDGGGLTFGVTVKHPEACITAMLVRLGADFDVVDDRLDDAVRWLLAQQLADGGWNCRTVRDGGQHGSFDTSILALEALLSWRRAGRDATGIADAEVRGRQFFLDHRMYRSHRTGEVVRPSYTRMVFPPGWHHDVLRGLDYFQASGALPDDRLGDAVDLVVARRRPDGRWRAQARHSGRYWFALEEPREPSRINTLRALRVLEWWQRS